MYILFTRHAKKLRVFRFHKQIQIWFTWNNLAYPISDSACLILCFIVFNYTHPNLKKIFDKLKLSFLHFINKSKFVIHEQPSLYPYIWLNLPSCFVFSWLLDKLNSKLQKVSIFWFDLSTPEAGVMFDNSFFDNSFWLSSTRFWFSLTLN